MMIVFAPLVVLTLLYFLLGNSSYKPTIAINENAIPSQLVSALKAQDTNIINIPSDTYNRQYLKSNTNIDAAFTISTSGSSINMYESSNKSAKAMKIIQGLTKFIIII